MATREILTSRQKAQGVRVLSDGFSGAIVNMEDVFRKGDEFTIPENFEVKAKTIRGQEAQFCDVQMKDGGYRELYPGMFTRSVMELNGNNQETGNWVRATGTAVDEFFKHGSIQEGMKALAGKKLKITDQKQVRCWNFDRTRTRNQSVFTIDIVE